MNPVESAGQVSVAQQSQAKQTQAPEAKVNQEHKESVAIAKAEIRDSAIAEQEGTKPLGVA